MGQGEPLAVSTEVRVESIPDRVIGEARVCVYVQGTEVQKGWVTERKVG